MSLADIAGHWPPANLPPELAWALTGGCALLVGMYAWLVVRRLLAARSHEVKQAASLFAIREIAACLQVDAPVDTFHLRDVLRNAPTAAVLQFLRLHRGEQQALVVEQAEQAGVFDLALRDLGRGVLTRKIAALKQLQFARAPRFRAAVLKQVTRGLSPMVRCEALYTFVAMGSTPSDIALTIWIDGTGPAYTPRHRELFLLIAERLPDALPHLARGVSNPQFQAPLAALGPQHHPPVLVADYKSVGTSLPAGATAFTRQAA